MGRGVLISVLVLAVFPGSASAAFTVAGTHEVGSSPSSIAVGDFNNDGNQDLAVASTGTDTVTVLTGNGAGGFATASTPATGDAAISVAVGDFNADGNQDLAVANFGGKSISVLAGDGTGKFTTKSTPGTGFFVISVAVGDFNADGKQDLATADINNNRLVLLTGDGAGNFTNAGTPAVGAAPFSVAVGDFNGDGNQDLAAANNDSDTVSVLSGNGTGGFATASTPTVGDKPQSVAVGDFNGDGNQDLAAANNDSDTVSVLAGNGTGGFATASTPESGDGPREVAAGDFDGDGKQDLATANSRSDTVSVLAGTGGGTFAPAGTVGVGDGPSALAAGDFNRDGNQDLATANEGAGTVSVLVSTDPPAANLLVEGDAEAPGAAGTLAASPPPPGWTREQGNFTFVRYGSPGGFVPMLFGPPLRGGLSHFAGGPATTGPGKSDSAASQTVDVSGSALAIDQGRSTAHLAGMLGGWRSEADRAQVTATFLDANGADLGGAIQIGPVTAAERKNVTGLLRRAASGPVPAGTRRVRVRIQTIFECCNYDDGYADNLSLTLSGEAVQPPPGDPGPGGGGGGTEQPLALSGLKIKPSKFRAASKGGPIGSAAAKKKPPVGATVSYTASRAAPATFKIARRASGVRKGKRCVAPPKRRSPGAKRCTRYVSVGSFKQLAAAGPNRLRFTGRISTKRALAPGTYRLSLSAVLPGASAVKAKDATFTIVR